MSAKAENRDPVKVVLSCDDVATAQDYFRDELGFRIDTVFPADAPRVIDLSGHGVSLSLRAPDAGPSLGLVVPENVPSLVVSRFEPNAFGMGRAGMQYRDLIPDRYGGRFIASHIRIPDGGPVPDYIHHHDIRFQFIYCVNGWVRVAYEDQGEPMLLHAGDAFLQPPHIRHQVLECSDGMEVLEMACPAEHETAVDHDMTLPTGRVDPARDFGGQRFVFDRAADAEWRPYESPGVEVRDSGIGEATGGIVAVTTVRATGAPASLPLGHDGEIRFLFVLCGNVLLTENGERLAELNRADACAIPPGDPGLAGMVSADAEFVEVRV